MVGVLAAGTVATGAALAAGARVGTATPPAAASLTYRCSFPSGPRLVPAGVTVGLPATVMPGHSIQPTGVTLTLTLPPTAVSSLASLRAARISAATKLTVGASEGPTGTSMVWPGTTHRPIPLRAHRSLVLTTSGAVPSVTTSSAGELILTAAGLTVTFTKGTGALPAPDPGQSPPPAADGRAAKPGRGKPGAATPGPAQGPFQVTCAPVPGQHTTLGTVLVAGPARQATPQATTNPCPKLPKGGLKLNPRFPLPSPPPSSSIGGSPEQGCAKTAGYADARKLNGAAFILPGLTNVDLFVRTVLNENKSVNYAEFDNAAELDYHGQHEFPPSAATFLTFGFVPTTATIQLVEHGTINIVAVGPALQSNCKPHTPCATVATVSSRLSVRIVPGSVKVNGVPLDVGDGCETPQFDAILTGTSASNPAYNVVTGGPLAGMVTIPKFSNCGVGENLDPIFNAAISGPRNFNLLTQGPVCFVLGGGVCGKHGPVDPKPILHKVIG